MGAEFTFISAVILLFLVLDPIGSVPLYLVTLKDLPRKRQKFVILRELLIAFVAVCFFLFLGQFFLEWVGLSQESIALAGGIILFVIGMKMIFPQRKHEFEEDFEGEPFVFPLAIPYIAGPSAFATVLLFADREPERLWVWFAAVVTAFALTTFIIYFASAIQNFVGKRGLIALERLMGMLTTAIAIEMILRGVRDAFVG